MFPDSAWEHNALVIGVECIPNRIELAKKYGCDVIVDFTKEDPVEAFLKLTGGKGVDSAIEALGSSQTFDACVSVTRPGGTIYNVGYHGDGDSVPIPREAWGVGMSDKTICTTLSLQPSRLWQSPRIAGCRTAFFDKTGTLTYGEPKLTDQIDFPDADSKADRLLCPRPISRNGNRSTMKTLIILMFGILLGTAQGQELEVSGLKLENVAYPFEVKEITFSIQGQDLTMAYMDAQPGTPNGNNVVARKYGIVFPLAEEIIPAYRDKIKLSEFNGNDAMELPLAATYVIDKSGKITYAFLDADYKKRAEPADVVEAVRAAAK